MAFYAKDKYTADGSTQSFAVTFPFISREHVTVTADGTAATFTWVNNGQITITSPSSLSSEALIIKRNSSPTTLLVDFVDGSNLTESDLDLLATQMFYLAQENIDEGGSVGFSDIDEVADAAVSTTAADLLISNGTLFTNVALSGDVTVNSSGVTAIGTSKVVSAMIANDSIVNADVKTDAAIDATKIADGSISNTEFQYLNGASSNLQTQISGISAGTIANLDDDNFTLLDNADGTKKAQFQCSTISGSTTRTFTFPDTSGTLTVGGISNISEDSSPQLGEDLDLVTHDIITTANRDINLIPNGTGDVVLAGDTVKVGDSGAAATLTSNGAGTLTVTTGGTTDLVLNTNSGTNSGNITITDAADGAITITPNGTGIIDLPSTMNPTLTSTGKALVLGF